VVPIVTLAEERAIEEARRAAAAEAARKQRAADAALQRWHRSRRKGLVPNTLCVAPGQQDGRAASHNGSTRALPRALPPL
jgi:hypothetical protein